MIEPIFESGLSGFAHTDSDQIVLLIRPIKEVGKTFLNCGLVNVIDADISDYFNNISHRKLLKLMAERITDGQILWLIRQWL